MFILKSKSLLKINLYLWSFRNNFIAYYVKEINRALIKV